MAKEKKKKKEQVKAGSEADVNTTHGLVTKAINLKLAAGILEAGQKDGDPNIDIDPKAIELGIKWCSHNDIKFADEETDQIKDKVSELEAIREGQRGRVVNIR